MVHMGTIKFSTSIKFPNFSWNRIDYEQYTVTHHLKSMMHQFQNHCIYFLFWINTSTSLVVYTWKETNTLVSYCLEQKVWWECVIRFNSIPSYTKPGEILSNSSKRCYVGGGLKMGGWVRMACMGSTNFFTFIKLPSVAWKCIDYERYTVTHHLKSMMHQWDRKSVV